MSSAALPTPPITVEQFLLRPGRSDGYWEELIEGEIYLVPNAKKEHSDVTWRIAKLLMPLEQSGYAVRGETAFRVSGFSLPNVDCCVVRQDKWDQVPGSEYPREAPAVAVEVASPGNRSLRRKGELYLEHGSEQVWIVYPKTKTVMVMTADGDREARVGEAVSFGGLDIPVDQIFGI